MKINMARSIAVIFLFAALGAMMSVSGTAQKVEDPGVLLRAAIEKEEVDGDLPGAIDLYKRIVEKFSESRAVAAQALLRLGGCYEKLGDEQSSLAQKAFEKLVADYPDQKDAVSAAKAKLAAFLRARAAIEKGAGEISIRKVWDNAPDSFFMGAPSPDGRYVTYVDWQKFANLGVRDLVKGENRLLTNNASWDDIEYCYNSVFSPDGRWIAFAWQTKEPLTQLRLISRDGSSTRILHDGKGVSYLVPFGWTADGLHVLTLLYGLDDNKRISLVSAVDGALRDVKAPPFKLPRSPRMGLSPDAKFVACSYLPQGEPARSDIALLSVEGGPVTPLVEHPSDDVVLGWSPDGTHVLFTSDRTGSIGIWAAGVSNGKPDGAPELVRGDMGNIRPMGITPNAKLYYGVYTGWSDIFIAPIDPSTGRVLDRPAKAVRKYESFNSAPDWSADGQFLVCRSSRGRMATETPALLILSRETNEVRELDPRIFGGLNFNFVRWSSDGRSVISTGLDENGRSGALVSIDARTGESRILARPDQNGAIFAPCPSPDGGSVFYFRLGREFRRIIKLDLETGSEREIHRLPFSPGPYWMALSPDGRQVAAYSDNKIFILSHDGAESRELVEAGGGTTLAWMADGKNILYGKYQEGSEEIVDLWVVPASGGEPRKTGLSMARLTHLQVSPDGTQIAFTASEDPGKSELWVLENFLPARKK